MRFDLTLGTEYEQARLQTALARCTYPFEAVAAGVTVPVTFRDLTADGALGLFWLDGRIEVHNRISDDLLLAEVLLSEIAHAVDQYALTAADRLRLQQGWHPSGPDEHTWFDTGPYETWSGEAFMGLFVAAYSDLRVTLTQFVHQPTPEMVALLRSLGPLAEPPPVYVGCRWSSVFHRKGAHVYTCLAKQWPTREAAIAAGRRPCGRCKP